MGDVKSLTLLSPRRLSPEGESQSLTISGRALRICAPLIFGLFGMMISACGNSGLMGLSTFSPDEHLGNPAALNNDPTGGLSPDYHSRLSAGSSTSIVDWGNSPMSERFTAATVDGLHKYGQNLMAATPSDAESFCPGFAELTEDQRLGFWTALVAAIALPESSFIPNNIFQGRGRGRDAITGQPIVGEGLLQLAYQDEQTYSSFVPHEACNFDYQTDQRYPRRDIRRSIQNPERNLGCGVAILDTLVRQDNRIAGGGNGLFKGGARYWQVLRDARTLQTIRTRTINFCKAVRP